MRKVVKPAHCDPENSVDLFDGDRKNEFGQMYCIAPGITSGEQVRNYWLGYIKGDEPMEFSPERNRNGSHNTERAKALERHARFVYEHDRD